MESNLMEITADGLKPISTEGKQDLKIGVILHWGGNMGSPARDYVIVDRMKTEFGVNYWGVSDDNRLHFISDHMIKLPNEEVRHTQYYFLTDKTKTEEEALKLYNKGKLIKEHEQKLQEERAIFAEQEEKKPLKVGDVFYTSWGYDQTNYDYIIVLEISPTGKTVLCRRASHKDRGHSGQAYIQEPTTEPFGDMFRLKVENYEGKIHLRGSYPFCHTGEGSKRLGGFSRHIKGHTYYETDTQFGH